MTPLFCIFNRWLPNWLSALMLTGVYALLLVLIITLLIPPNSFLITPYSQLLRRLGANLKFLNESRSFQWPRIKCNFRKA